MVLLPKVFSSFDGFLLSDAFSSFDVDFPPKVLQVLMAFSSLKFPVLTGFSFLTFSQYSWEFPLKRFLSNYGVFLPNDLSSIDGVYPSNVLTVLVPSIMNVHKFFSSLLDKAKIFASNSKLDVLYLPDFSPQKAHFAILVFWLLNSQNL